MKPIRKPTKDTPLGSALRPHVTAGVALVGASLITVTSVPPHPPSAQVRAVQLTDADATSGADPETVVLVMGGSNTPFVPQSHVEDVNEVYVQPHFPGAVAQSLGYPAQNYPGPHAGFLDPSTEDGQQIMNAAIMTQIGEGHHVVVWGTSQSASVQTLEMRYLASLPPDERPSPDQLAFINYGDPNLPNGGLFPRFDFPNLPTGQDLGLPSLFNIPGLGVLTSPSIGITFFGATPADTPYPTFIYTGEYDGYGDSPLYPDDILADLNAILGIDFVHDGGSHKPASFIDQAFIWPTSPGYDGDTTYYLVPVQNLPLLDPLREIPLFGTPLADLLQPDLKVLVNLGYGPDDVGYSEYPNVDTHLQPGLPDVPLSTLFNELAAGAKEGIQNFETDLSQISPSDVEQFLGGLVLEPLPLLTGIGSALTLGVIPQISFPKVTPDDLTFGSLNIELQTLLTRDSNDLVTLLYKAIDPLIVYSDANLLFTLTVPTYDVDLILAGFGQLFAGKVSEALTYFEDVPAANIGLAVQGISDTYLSAITTQTGGVASAIESLVEQNGDFLAGLPGLF